MLSCIIDSMEGQDVATVNIPGGLLYENMDEIVNMQIDGEMSELITRVDTGQYEKYVITEKGKKILYVRLKKALYGT